MNIKERLIKMDEKEFSKLSERSWMGGFAPILLILVSLIVLPTLPISMMIFSLFLIPNFIWMIYLVHIKLLKNQIDFLKTFRKPKKEIIEELREEHTYYTKQIRENLYAFLSP